mgnify:FL=1|jgi:hypothetical protein
MIILLQSIISWIKERIEERTSMDGVALIALSVVVLYFNSISMWAAFVGLAYGCYTFIKSE